MTMSQIKEGVVSKLGALLCTHIDGSSHIPFDSKEVLTKLDKLGFKMGDKERMHDGRTGKPISTVINIAPVYYQCLIKFAKDAVYAVTKGISNTLTRQPQEGKRNKGGGRLGYMEVESLLTSHGMRVVSSKLFDHSDSATFVLCTTCRRKAIYNPDPRDFRLFCPTCKEKADFAKFDSAWSPHMAFDFMKTANAEALFKPSSYKLYIKEK
jgi:DNA-directed RNA polymerase beta subunit